MVVCGRRVAQSYPAEAVKISRHEVQSAPLAEYRGFGENAAPGKRIAVVLRSTIGLSAAGFAPEGPVTGAKPMAYLRRFL
jgi:hypothetical protein